MAGMPGLISDREGSSYSQLSAAMHAFTECMVHGIMWTIPFFFLAQRQLKKNVVDVLNKVNSLSLQTPAGFTSQERISDPRRSGAARPQLRKHRQLKNGDLASHDVN